MFLMTLERLLNNLRKINKYFGHEGSPFKTDGLFECVGDFLPQLHEEGEAGLATVRHEYM